MEHREPENEPTRTVCHTPIAEREPLCRLAVNASNKGMSGKWRLIAATVLCTLFMVGEVVGGIYAHSLAVLTDAAHMLSDVLAFVISLSAGTYALRRSKSTHTFGYHRAEVVGSLVSIAIIWVVTGILVYEAVQRVIHPERVDGKLMFIVAIAGMGVNVINLFVLGGHGHSHEHKEGQVEHNCDDENVGMADGHIGGDHFQTPSHSPYQTHSDPGLGRRAHSNDRGPASLGLKSAAIHVLGDSVQSLGVVIAAIVIWVKPEYHIADPICTFIFAIAVLLTTRGMVRDITDIIMERVPRGFDLLELKGALSRVDGVASLHDLHVWAIKPGVVILAVHIDILSGSSPAAVLRGVTSTCKARGIHHSTIQMSTHGDPCPCDAKQSISVVMQSP